MENFLQDKVDRSLAEWGDQLADVDLTVEAIVQRIDSLARGLKKSMDVTLGEFSGPHPRRAGRCSAPCAGQGRPTAARPATWQSAPSSRLAR